MTELIWDGKYDKDGRKTAPLRVALPFQTVETVNESAADRQRTLNMFAQGRETEWRNRLIWGDKKYVLPSLLPEFAGKVNLIYIDPPFNVGVDFAFTTTFPDSDESFTKEPSIIEQKAYRDTWGRGMDSYLQWFYETVVLLHELLAEDGSIYVHLDWHVVHYAKIVLDEVFGPGLLKNEVVWKRSAIATSVSTQWRNSHDTLLFYGKDTADNVFNVQYGEYSESSKKHYSRIDERGSFRTVPLMASGRTSGISGQPWRGIDVANRGKNGMHWLKSPDILEQLEKDKLILWNSEGIPELKYYLDEAKGVYVSDFWDDITVINSMASESVGYATQKPEALLERIIKASSNEGDLVLDCFAGSGTTATVAEKLKRRWITCDLGRFAIHTTRKRLLGIPEITPFVVQNLGKYERQAWQATLSPGPSPKVRGEQEKEGNATQTTQSLRPSPLSPSPGGRGVGGEGQAQRRYIEFILQLFNAKPISGYAWLHGVRGGRMVHVGSVDAPVSLGDVTNIAIEFRKAVGSGKDAPTSNSIDVLGWDFAFEMNEVARQQAAAANIQMRFLRIPRDVMDKRATDSGEIRFFELAALEVEPTVAARKREVVLKLTNFVIPPDDVPEEVRTAIKSWEQWIDYWAVDWDNKSDTFHNEWQSYRTRKDKTLQKQVTNTYEQPGEYRVVVKVIDILGNDTTKTLMVRVQ